MGIESWNRGLSIWLQRLEALYYGIPQTRGTDQARLPSLFLPVKVISRSSEKMIVHAPVRWISRVWEHRSPLSGIMFSNSHYSGRWSRKLVTFPNFLRARTPRRHVNSDSAMQAQMHVLATFKKAAIAIPWRFPWRGPSFHCGHSSTISIVLQRNLMGILEQYIPDLQIKTMSLSREVISRDLLRLLKRKLTHS